MEIIRGPARKPSEDDLAVTRGEFLSLETRHIVEDGRTLLEAMEADLPETWRPLGWLAAVLFDPTGESVLLKPLVPGPDFGVTEDGQLTVAYQPWLIPMADYGRAIDLGYAKLTEHRAALLAYPAGGGNGHPAMSVVEWLLDTSPGVLAGMGAEWLRQRIVGERDRHAARLARRWANHGLNHPRYLRLWIERKPSWFAVEVAGRLGLPEPAAAALLVDLGYEVNDRGLYERTSSPLALKRKEDWLARERDTYTWYLRTGSIDPRQED